MAVPGIINGFVGISIMLVVITITSLSLYCSHRVAVATGHAPPLDEDAAVPSRAEVFWSTVKKASVTSFSFTIYLVRTIQLVALSMQSAQNPIPKALSTVMTWLEVTLMELPEIHFDCLGKMGAYFLDYVVIASHITLTILYVLLSLRFIGITKWRRCGIPREDPDVIDAEAPSRWSKFIRWFARTGHPLAMSTVASLLSMLDPVLVTRAHRVLHCIKTPTGLRLKENADLLCNTPDHEKIVLVAIIGCVMGLAGFVWISLQPWYRFVRRPPPLTEAAVAADAIVLADREAAAAALDGDAIIPDAVVHHSQEFLLEIKNAEERAEASPCINALYQVGLDPRGRSCNRVCRRCNCGGVAQTRPRNLMLHLDTFDAFDGIDAFGFFDADIRPYVFWFAPLQGLVSSALGLLAGIFGGSHAAGLVRSKTAHLLGGSTSIALLLALGGIAFLVWPYRGRKQDSCVFVCFSPSSVAFLFLSLILLRFLFLTLSPLLTLLGRWKTAGLFGTIIVACLFEALSFAMSMRTRTDSVAYSVFIEHFSTLVAVCCVGNFVSLGVAYISKLGVGRALLRILESAAVRLKPAIVRCWHVCTEKCVRAGNDDVDVLEMVETGAIGHERENPFYGAESGGVDAGNNDADVLEMVETGAIGDESENPFYGAESGGVDGYFLCPETGKLIATGHERGNPFYGAESGGVDEPAARPAYPDPVVEYFRCPETGKLITTVGL